MVMSAWLEDRSPPKDVWKFVSTLPGEQCVMTSGEHLRLRWCVDSWGILLLGSPCLLWPCLAKELILSCWMTWDAPEARLDLWTVLPSPTTTVSTLKMLGSYADHVSLACALKDSFQLFFSLLVDCQDGDVRLVNGAAENEGRVEICFNKEWGTICDDRWDGKEALVVCRQLGYSDAEVHVALHEAFFGSGPNPIHLDEVNCVGNEERLSDCQHAPLGIHNCLQEEDASVLCTGETLSAGEV